MAVSIGYNNEAINDAVKKQLERGVSFSPTKIECEVAELLIDMVPCAEMVRFGKNGSDVTSAAIRLARGYTGNQRVAVCGYHGWHDWYIGTTTRDLGVPETVSKLTHTFKYNDIESLRGLIAKYNNEFAAIILEPMNLSILQKIFLNRLERWQMSTILFSYLMKFVLVCDMLKVARKNFLGSYLIFVYWEKGWVMDILCQHCLVEKKLWRCVLRFSFSTFGGEAVSLAAAKQVLTMVRDCEVLEKINDTGEKIISGVEKIILDNGLDEIVSISGHPSWSFITIKEEMMLKQC